MQLQFEPLLHWLNFPDRNLRCSDDFLFRVQRRKILCLSDGQNNNTKQNHDLKIKESAGQGIRSSKNCTISTWIEPSLFVQYKKINQMKNKQMKNSSIMRLLVSITFKRTRAELFAAVQLNRDMPFQWNQIRFLRLLLSESPMFLLVATAAAAAARIVGKARKLREIRRRVHRIAIRG